MEKDGSVEISPLLKEVLLSKRTDLEEVHESSRSNKIDDAKFDDIFNEISNSTKTPRQSGLSYGENSSGNTLELRSLGNDDLSLIIPLD